MTRFSHPIKPATLPITHGILVTWWCVQQNPGWFTSSCVLTIIMYVLNDISATFLGILYLKFNVVFKVLTRDQAISVLTIWHLYF